MKEIFNTIWELAFPYQDKRDDKGHAEVTLKYAKELVKIENGDEDVVIPAIILHDVGWSQLPKERALSIFKKDTKEEERKSIVQEHQRESVRVAREILKKVNYPDNLTEEILEIVSQHDTREGFISKNEGLVRDADKLWRTSTEGFAAGEARIDHKDPEREKKAEEQLSKKEYIYSETARKIAQEEFKKRQEERKARDE